MGKSKIPYENRSDRKKIVANWKKAKSHYSGGDYSAAIVRAATTAEIAANHLVRKLLVAELHVSEHFVDALLKWANGIFGKYTRIICPLVKGTSVESRIRKLRSAVQALSEHRNGVVHGGRFKSRTAAIKAIEEARRVVVALAPEFKGDVPSTWAKP